MLPLDFWILGYWKHTEGDAPYLFPLFLSCSSSEVQHGISGSAQLVPAYQIISPAYSSLMSLERLESQNSSCLIWFSRWFAHWTPHTRFSLLLAHFKRTHIHTHTQTHTRARTRTSTRNFFPNVETGTGAGCVCAHAREMQQRFKPPDWNETSQIYYGFPRLGRVRSIAAYPKYGSKVAASDVGRDVKVCKRPHKANTHALELKCVIGECMILQSSIDTGKQHSPPARLFNSLGPRIRSEKGQHQVG